MSWEPVFWYAGVFIRSGKTDGGKALTTIFSAIVGGMYSNYHPLQDYLSNIHELQTKF